MYADEQNVIMGYGRPTPLGREHKGVRLIGVRLKVRLGKGF